MSRALLVALLTASAAVATPAEAQYDDEVTEAGDEDGQAGDEDGQAGDEDGQAGDEDAAERPREPTGDDAAGEERTGDDATRPDAGGEDADLDLVDDDDGDGGFPADETSDPGSVEMDDIEVPDIASEDFDVDELLDMVPDLEIEWGGKVQSDLRFRLEDKSVGDWYDRRELPVGIARNENLLGARMTARYGDVTARADIDFVLYGFAQDVEGLADLYRREKLDPFRFDVHRLYVEMKNLLVDGFDLTVGQQLILWGVGDQFNPTNNFNPDDIEDVLLFGDQRGTFMVKADYWITPEWQLSGLMIPVFQPALLPRTAPLALAQVDRIPLTDSGLRQRLLAEQAAAKSELVDHPTVVDDVRVIVPERRIENVQWGYRIAGNLLGQDVAASYYYGRTDFPVPFLNHTVQDRSEAGCNPNDPNDCIGGLLETTTYLWYPRMHVYGFNMAGEIGWLSELSDAIKAIGYRLEVALVVPQRATLQLVNDQLDLGLITQPAGEYDYDNDGRPGARVLPAVVDDRPFPKWTFGLDYTISQHLYLNVQWVHGLADEFGEGSWLGGSYALRQGTVDTDGAATAVQCALPGDGTTCVREILRPRIGDYLVSGLDVKLLEQKLLLRLFTIFDLAGVVESYWDESRQQRVRDHHSLFTEDGFSAVIYPEANYNFGNGLDVGLGALVLLGKRYTKFGDPAAGGTMVWGRTRFAF